MPRILVIEDDATSRAKLKATLEEQRYLVEDVASVAEAIENHPLPAFDLIITDLRLPGQPGTDIIQLAQGVPVLVMTSYAGLRSAVDAMKLGAVDYIAKPFDQADILEIISNIISQPEAKDEAELSEKQAEAQIQQLIYGRCPAMKKVFTLMRKTAPTDATVLIQGETGSGKELAARAIHQLSQRRQKNYLAINCAAIPETLIESELFGHEKGSFTGAIQSRTGVIEAADGGTLFLDEIGELPLDAQARLLRVLQEGEIRRVGSTQSKRVDVRMIAATHRNLKALARTGQFREDLYYRLNVITLKLPPLRERGNDIIGLAQMLLEKTARKFNRREIKFSPEAMKLISDYHWPGNVRELENAIERGIILADDEVITPDLLDIEYEVDDINIPQGLITPHQSSAYNPNPPQTNRALSMEDYFQQFVLENQDRMSETELAKRLGISRKSLWERRQRLGIPRKK